MKNCVDFKLDFVVAGAQKAGTTAINHYLKQHPQISMGKIKELHFFDNEELFKEPGVDYTILHKQIEISPTALIYGECTPIYMYWEPAMRRIKEYNPEIKIIVILRNPILRAFSHWNMETSRNAEHLSFYESILQEQERILAERPLQHRVYSYADRGFYSVQLNRIFNLFRRDQVLILKYESFYSRQPEELNKCFDFLGVDKNLFTYNRTTVHAIDYKKGLTKKEIKFLSQLFEPEIIRLEAMLGWNCDDWKIC